jgi:hypothetical protein
MDVPKPRRWFRFSLRTMFVLVTVAAVISLGSPPMVKWLFPPRFKVSDSIVIISEERLVAQQGGVDLEQGVKLKNLPKTEDSLVLRTHFTDDAAWDRLCRAIQKPVGDFRAYVECVSNLEYDGLTPRELVDLNSRDAYHLFAFVVDKITFEHPEHPVLVVDLHDVPGRTFRVVPNEMWSVENNLSLANMDFDEFADSVNQDGVFRGFPPE